jgi:hypothetical protein
MDIVRKIASGSLIVPCRFYRYGRLVVLPHLLVICPHIDCEIAINPNNRLPGLNS